VDGQLAVGAEAIPIGRPTGDEEAAPGFLLPPAAGALADLLSLIFGDDAADVIEEPPLCRVTAWTARPFDRHATRLDLLDEDELVRELARESVRIADEDNVDCTGADGVTQFRKRRPVERRTGIAVIDELGTGRHGVTFALGERAEFTEL
jgi:hypothetical protein